MARLHTLLNRNKLQLSGAGLITFLLVLLAFISNLFHDDEDKVRSDQPQTALMVTSPCMPQKIDFCGEKVPLQYFDVSESMERELIVNTYFHSQTLLNIKRSRRYFPIIEPILKANGIPDDFKYLAMAESGFSYIVSPRGAAGFWQLLEGTARDYGLTVNEEVDERYHLEKATEAACMYLKDSYQDYGNWTMVAASYNVGRKGVERQIERQGETDYYNLLLNEETARYVFRILALKAVLETPEKYYFFVPELERYPEIPYREEILDGSVADFGEFAKARNTNYKMLKFLNPWLRDNQLQNKEQKEYVIRIPTTREP